MHNSFLPCQLVSWQHFWSRQPWPSRRSLPICVSANPDVREFLNGLITKNNVLSNQTEWDSWRDFPRQDLLFTKDILNVLFKLGLHNPPTSTFSYLPQPAILSLLLHFLPSLMAPIFLKTPLLITSTSMKVLFRGKRQVFLHLCSLILLAE